MEVLERLSCIQKSFNPAGSLDARLALDSIQARVLPIDVKSYAAQNKLVDLYNDQDDEGEVMLLAMILLQINGVKIPTSTIVPTLPPSSPSSSSSLSPSILLSSSSSSLSSSEDGMDADDDPLNKKKRQRTSPDQLAILESMFQTDKMPNQQTRVQLADQLGMSSRRVQIWFQNKRAKVKRSNLKPGECESPSSELNESSSSDLSPSSPSSPSMSVPSDSPVQSPSSPGAAVVPQMGNPLKRSFSQVEAPSTVPCPSFVNNSAASVPSSSSIKPAPLNIFETTKQLKAQQLFSLTSPFTDTQPVLTASY